MASARERPPVAVHRRWHRSELRAAVAIPFVVALCFIAACWVLGRPLAIWSVGVALSAAALISIDWSTAVWRERQRQRREADTWLSTSTGSGVPSRYAARAEKLCSAGERRALAKGLRNHIAAAQSTRLYGSFIVNNRVGIRENVDLLRGLAAKLDDLDQPITPAGVLLIRHLLADATSPLHSRRRNPDLKTALSSASSVLEPH